MNSDTIANKSPWKNAALLKGGRFIAREVSIEHGSMASKIYTLKGKDGVTAQVDSVKDADTLAKMKEFEPAISTLSEASRKTKRLVFAHYWTVDYCWQTRIGRDVRVVTAIEKTTDPIIDETPQQRLRIYGQTLGLTEDEINLELRFMGESHVDEEFFRNKMAKRAQDKENATVTISDRAEDDMLNEETAEDYSDFTPSKLGVADEQTAQDNPAAITDEMIAEHELDPKQIRFAIPGHLDKTYGKGKGGLHVRHIFGAKGFDDWYEHHEQDSKLAWRLVLQYELKNPPVAALKDEDVKPTETKPQTDEKQNRPLAGATTPSNAPAGPVEPSSQPTLIAPNISPSEHAIEGVIVEPAKSLMLLDKPATVDAATGEIIDFDPSRLLDMAKGKVALLTRTYQEILVAKIDYGKVPGSEKDCLFKPGAEKLLATFEFYDRCVSTVNSVSDWKNGFFNFEYECTVYSRTTGRIEGTGIGSCNSKESKYRYRWLWDNEAKAQGYDLATMVTKKFNGKNGKEYTKYRVENDDIFDQVNTLSKMAQKRALIAATLNATGASAIFTQDLEDFKDFGVFDEAA